jgi:branched-chain amino acid transport system ATP-binding protein
MQAQRAGTLSGGERQMLAIGRALMAKPELLILDEPSLGLAPLIVEDIFKVIRRINEDEGVTILIVEQNVHLALEIANYAYILENGAMAGEGESAELLSDARIQEAYLGL